MRLPIVLACTGLLIAFSATAATVGREEMAQTDRAAVGRIFSPVATILVRESGQGGWKLPQLFDDIHAGARLLTLPGARGVVDLREGDVRLTLAGNLPELSSAPVLESASILHEGRNLDADLTLERGRIILESRREDGPVKIRIRTTRTSTDVSLAKKGTMVVVEVRSECVPGTPFSPDPKKAIEPDRSLVLLIVKGRADVALAGAKHTLAGPATLQWSSRHGMRGPTPLQKLPVWLSPSADLSARATAWHRAVEDVRRRVAEKKSLSGGLAEVRSHGNPMSQAVAIFSAGAVGNVDQVLAALNRAGPPEVRRAAAVTLRHFMGRSKNDDLAVYQALLKTARAPEAQLVMQLLHGFGEKLGPKTAETLIGYLQHESLAVRELAAWNLYRLVPKGKETAYDAAGSEQERGQAQAAWRKLLAK